MEWRDELNSKYLAIKPFINHIDLLWYHQFQTGRRTGDIHFVSQVWHSLRYFEITPLKSGLSKLVISYHKHKLNPILVHYIYHQSKKGKTCEKDSPLLKNDITDNLEPQKPVIYSRYMEFQEE